MDREINDKRYQRNFNTLTLEEQEQLARCRVTIIGLGGLGGGVCEMLARIGVGHLTLVDGDRFDATNLNRQLLSRDDLLGTPKALAAKQRLGVVNSSIRVDAFNQFAHADNLDDLIRGSDLVMDCLDTIDTRFLLQDAARKCGIPLVAGAIAGVAGQVMVIFPEDRGYELIYGPREQSRSTGMETRTGNISFCATMIASVQCSEAVKVLLNRGEILRNKLLIVDLMTNAFQVVQLC